MYGLARRRSDARYAGSHGLDVTGSRSGRTLDCPQTSIGRGGERLGPVTFLVSTGAHLAVIRLPRRTMRP